MAVDPMMFMQMDPLLLSTMDPSLLEAPLSFLGQGGQKQFGPAPAMPPARGGFESMLTPMQGPNLTPGVQIPPAVIEAPIIEKGVPAQATKKPELTADQLAKLAAGMQTPDTGQRLPSPGTPASGRTIEMGRLGAAPQQQAVPMTLAQLLSGRR